MAFKSMSQVKGGKKQFGGGAGKTPFTATPAKATAAMQGTAPPSGKTPSIAKAKGAKKQFQKAGGKKVF